jgi:hypothetical protein
MNADATPIKADKGFGFGRGCVARIDRYRHEDFQWGIGVHRRYIGVHRRFQRLSLA